VELKTQDPETHALLARMINRYPGRDLTRAGVPVGAAQATLRVEAVSQPILIINGEFDLESRRRNAKQLMSRSSLAECVSIPDAGHLCGLDNPRAYNLAVSRFLSRHIFSAFVSRRTVL
jgi:pimeloyl-ACP methyl ester carboxylesterase